MSLANSRTDARSDVLSLLDQMHRAARDPVRIHQITDQLEVLARSYLAPGVSDPVPDSHLTKTEQRLLARLMQSAGNMVTREYLMDAIYFDRHNEPVVKIIDVYVCKLRKKLQGSQYVIENVHGQGYRLDTIS